MTLLSSRQPPPRPPPGPSSSARAWHGARPSSRRCEVWSGSPWQSPFAAWSGEARDFFRPGIYVDAVYALAFAASVLIGRPLVEVIYRALYRRGRGWRAGSALRRVLIGASLGWSLVYSVRAGAQ